MTSAHASHATPAPDACSVGFDRADISAYGTAAGATFFVALEQPGPWGRDAATQSHLPAGVGSSLSKACADRGGRLSLIRRPGRHADDVHGGAHTAYLAWAGRDPWMVRLTVTDPAALLELDLDALARGDREAVTAATPDAEPAEPILLICTNGRRDVCCAVRGRPVALDAAADHPGRVWEASHTGGHRFSPTGVLLPHGATLARLDADLSAQLLDRAGSGHLPAGVLGPRHDRGRSPLGGPAQAAESHVRHEEGITDLTALTVTQVPGPGVERTGDEAAEASVTTVYAVRHRDGRSWRVMLERRAHAELPESCGKSPVPVMEWVARTQS
ncbi:hypothetical protein BJ986_000024 [Phycicoccus badiiscoriae]|uniref:Sucrase ferredoxin n=1 Tax=Pedococcus badiiscoriae TaxID=642776 RepID=A0A852W8L1_9MICO|nr:hypothetical protein [Pedococcus badiiscoriae]